MTIQSPPLYIPKGWPRLYYFVTNFMRRLDMRLAQLFVLALLMAGFSQAQISQPYQIRAVASHPSGSCPNALFFQYDYADNTLWGCQGTPGSLTWAEITGGGGGGGMSIGGTVTSGTTGSVLFIGSGPVLAQDNANFFWDDTLDQLDLSSSSGTGDGIIGLVTGVGLDITNGSTAQFRLLPSGNDIYFENTHGAGNTYFTGPLGAPSTGQAIFLADGLNCGFGPSLISAMCPISSYYPYQTLRSIFQDAGDSNGILSDGGLQIAVQGQDQSTAGAGNINFFTTPTNSSAGSDATYVLQMQLAYNGNLTLFTGDMTIPAISAPSSPSSGFGSLYEDSTSLALAFKNAAGTVSHTAQTKAAVSHNFLTALSDAGVFSAAQPAFSDLSGSVTCGQLPALTGDATSSAGSCGTTVVKVNGVSYGTSPSTNTVPVVTGSNAVTYEAVPNAALANDDIVFANGTGISGAGTVVLGGTYTPAVTSNTRMRAVGAGFDGGGSALTSGSTATAYFTVPFACTISAWDATVDTGTITFDVWKVATGTAIPTVTNTITSSALPAISTGTALHSTTLTGWTTSVSADDIFGININTVATATKASLILECATSS